MATKSTALLVGVVLTKKKSDVSESLNELEQLADTSGSKVTDTVIQKMEKPNPKFFIGAGKVFEIKKICEEKKINIVIFDDELTPAQQRNLEKNIQARIIDRTQLILYIFAQRARSPEAKLQIELAEKAYRLPRLTGKELTLAQQTGVRGTRSGFGEKKLEVDKRRIRDRISYLKKEIEKIKSNREVQRSKRQDVPLPVVSLVGYTNVGKSTMLNCLTGKNSVYADDKLFATLDATTRKVKLSDGKSILFTDTVGFIKKLPHQLVAAFKSTMEEITQSDLIVHLIDISNPEHKENEKTVMAVLKDIGADSLPMINVYNKCDLIKPEFSVPVMKNNFCVSAKTGKGIHGLLKAISEKFEHNLKPRKIFLPYSLFSVIDVIKSVGKILRYQPRENCTELDILIDEKNWGQLQKKLNENSYAAQ